MLFVGFVALGGRAFYLMGGVSTEFLQRQGEARYARTLELPATRGRVTDRNGIVLASSVPARAIWAIPDDVDGQCAAQLAELARLLQLELPELKRRLANDDRSFVYLHRQVDVEIAERIAALNIAGIHTSREFKRHYPEGPTSAHVVGFTNVEDRGQEGIELAFERQLAGRAGSRRVIKDRLGRIIEDDVAARAARRPRHRAVDRQPRPVHRIFRAQSGRRETPGQGRRGCRARRADRRSARARQLAELRPERRAAACRATQIRNRVDHRHASSRVRR